MEEKVINMPLKVPEIRYFKNSKYLKIIKTIKLSKTRLEEFH